MVVDEKERKIIQWEAIETMIDAIKALVDVRRKEGEPEIEDIYSCLVWASEKAYTKLKKLRLE